jgi:hypothetical protein
VFRHRLPAEHPRPSTPSAAYEDFVAGIPNTLPPQNLNGCWSLAASDFAPGSTGETKKLLPPCGCKTGIYNTLRGPWSITG